MPGVNDKPAKGWNWLAEAAKEQSALFGAIREATEKALEAAMGNDTDKLEDALSCREELMQQVEVIQTKEREIRSKVAEGLPLKLADDLSMAADGILEQLEQTMELNTKLEQELSRLKQRLDNERKRVSKLRQTAEGYRPKDLSEEGLFVDWKR